MRLSESWRLCLASVVVFSLLTNPVFSEDDFDQPIEVSIDSDSDIDVEFAVETPEDAEETDE